MGRLRAVLERADAVAIAAPEYAGGVAGWVKNALDWLVGSATLYGRPVAVFSAGTTGGPHALAQLARTLAWQGAHVVAAVGVEAVRTKLDHDGRLAEPAALAAIGCAAQRLLRAAQGTDDERAALAAATLRPLGIDPVDRRPR